MTINELSNIEPDEKGMITVILDGVKRRFIKDKLLTYLSKDYPPIKPVMAYGEHRRRAIIAELPDGTRKRFHSSSEAAQILKINRSNIPHVLSGRYQHVKGIKFRYV